MRSLTYIYLAIAICAVCGLAQAAPAKVQTLESIDATVQGFLVETYGPPDEDVQYEAGGLDERLRLAACPAKLVAFLPPGNSSRTLSTVGVRCPEGAQWTVYVPVTVKQFGEIVVTRHPLPRGHILSESDLTTMKRDEATIRGTFISRIRDAVGMQLRRPMRAQTALNLTLLEAPNLIKRGQRVTLRFDTPGLEISVMGKALMDGAAGEVIRVENSKSGRIVEGRVTSHGSVEVTI